MIKWEYAREYTENLDKGRGGAGIVGAAGSVDWTMMGENGWELVTIYKPRSVSHDPVAIFKRQRKE